MTESSMDEDGGVAGSLPSVAETTDGPPAPVAAGDEVPAAEASPEALEQMYRSRPSGGPVIFELKDVSVTYGSFRAIEHVDLDLHANEITAFIGPSGCGKTTVLRVLNRMHDTIPGAIVGGGVFFHDSNIYGPGIDPAEVRRRIGMVFQKPNPFPKSVYDNIAYGPRINGIKKKAHLDDIVEHALTRAALWDEVKAKLGQSGLGLSGGQQQRLCIARALAVEPEVLLMDEPCSALDPIATTAIEDLMLDLASDLTIVIVTHNMQQAKRVAQKTAFFTAELDVETGHRQGHLVEFDTTDRIFNDPSDRRTAGYVAGEFG